MANHFILCVLSTINTRIAKNEGYTFKANKEERHFLGCQTNEAPAQCLIDLALRANNPITVIICLTSRQCETPVLLPGDSEPISAKDHFEQTITRFYDKRLGDNHPNPARNDGFFITVNYDSSNPTASMRELISIIDSDDTLIDIDTTGGPRDAAFLLTTIVQFIEAKFDSVKRSQGKKQPIGLGTTIYVNFGNKMMYPQNETFALNDLIHAIESFTEYGKADALVEYFDREHETSDEMKHLCKSIQSFADDLSLCRTKNVNTKINNIHAALDDFMKMINKKTPLFDKSYGLLAQLDNSDSMQDLDVMKRTISEELGLKVEVNEPSVDRRWSGLASLLQKMSEGELQSCETKNDLLEYLRKTARKNKVSRGEILFSILADNLRRGIPEYTGANVSEEVIARQTISIIRWCVERGMLQQALALYKERIPECLVQNKLISWGKNPPRNRSANRENAEMVNRIVQLTSCPRLNSQGGNKPNGFESILNESSIDTLAKKLKSHKPNSSNPLARYELYQIKQVLCAALPDLAAKEDYVQVLDRERLSPALVWFFIINSIRNDVMHVNEEDNRQLEYYLPLCRVFFQDMKAIDCHYNGTPSSLKDALQLALKAAEGMASLHCKQEILEWINVPSAKDAK